MREILFRGKRVDNGEWVVGFPYPSIGLDSGKWFMTEIHGTGSCSTSNTYAVDPATIGQYTGLKDKNGTRIFEGDIIKYRDMLFVISWQEENGRFLGIEKNRFRPDGGNYCCYVGEELQVSEVVGNIHDKEGDNG